MRNTVVGTMYTFAWLDIFIWLGVLVFGRYFDVQVRDLIIVLHSLAIAAVLWCVCIPLCDSRVWSMFVCRASLHAAIATLAITVWLSVYLGVFKASLGSHVETVVGGVVAVASQLLAYGVTMWGIQRSRSKAAKNVCRESESIAVQES